MTESKFRFRNPVLDSVLFHINEDFMEDEYEGLGIIGKTKIAKVKEGNKATVKFALEIGEKAYTMPFYIKLAMKAEFEWADTLEDGLVDKLLRANAPSLLLAYMRPIVANITGSSEYPMFHIPYMDMSGNEAVFEEAEEGEI